MDACLGRIVGLPTEGVMKYVKRHGAYVIRYKNKVQLLEQENKRLGEKKERIRGMVDRATNKGEVIETEVSSWLTKVEQMEGDINNFLRQPGDGESFRRFLGCMCPNLVWCHKRGMEAHKRKSDVNDLINTGERLERLPVSHAAPFQSELHLDSSQYYTTFQSRASVVEEIKNALKDSGVDVIGVHGPGGAGKTTMVTEVAKEAKALGIFDKFVIAVVSKDPNTSKIQKELASQLDFNYKQRSEIGRADELQKALLNGKRKILVILDDLWQELHLNAMGIPRGCKILLTSRNKEVFKKMEAHLCSIGYLEEQEAWELFTKVTGAFGVDESIARKVSKRCGGLPIAIMAVGGALKGEEEVEWLNALNELQSRPLKYIEGIDHVDYTPLKWSYDFLKDEDAKSCFLLCCLFPEDFEIDIDDLVRYGFALGFLRRVDMLKDARIKVQAKVNKLKKFCLLLNGKNKNFVKMHDVIRDLAISITEEKQAEHGGGRDWPGQQQFIVNHNIQEWPKNDAWEHHTVFSLRINDDNIQFPSGVIHCPLMHTIVLKRRGYILKIPNDFFQGMEAARVLGLEGVFMDSPSSISELDHLRMLRLNNHYRLRLNNYYGLSKDLPSIRNLKNHIEIFCFQGDMIEELSQEIGKLTRLRSLDLRECFTLKAIPKGVISDLIHLEELYVVRSFKEWDNTIYGGGIMSNASIAELKSLNQLRVLHGISTKSYRIMVPECRNLFERLINFSIFMDDGFCVTETQNYLAFVDIHDIDDEFCLLMDRVETLALSDIQDLRYLLGKPQLQFTLGGGGSFCKLIDLNIFRCHSLKYLFSPSCAKAFQRLKTLAVRDCSRMEQIIGLRDHCNEEEVVTDEAIIFSRLGRINLSRLPQFRSFCPKMEKTTIEGNPSNWTTIAESIFNEKVSFPVLEELTIDELPVEDIWNKQTIQSPKESNKVSFSQLKNMEVIKCHNLVNVFPSNMLPQLQNLETLYVQGCPSLTVLVEDLNPSIQSPVVKFKLIDEFPKLRHLRLHDLPKLMKIWLNDEDYCSNDNFVHLYIQTISIKHCDSLRHAFSAFVARHLACLEGLQVEACLRMEVIISEAMGGGVTSDGIIEFCQLKSLRLEDLPNLKSFYQPKSKASHSFNHQVTFPRIESLHLIDLKSSREIQLWDLLATTQECLRTVSITKCQVSTKVSSHHQKRSFRTIVVLSLDSCWGFKHVIDLNGTISTGEEQFANMKELNLYELPELVSLWNKNLNEIGGLRSLKKIVIRNCSQLRSLFTHSMAISLQHLEALSVRSCEMMEEIIIIEENNINFAGEEKATHHIEFLKLETLILDNLQSVKNFCRDERGSFSFPSLCSIRVWDCPKMKTFASGQIYWPPRTIKAWVGGDEWIDITDVNALFESKNDDNDPIFIKLGR